MTRYLSLILISLIIIAVKVQSKIDRYKLVNRHNPVNRSIDPWSPFTVGNGGFAFTADITGLQTFPDYYYKNGIPLQIISDWAWHSFPNPRSYKLKDSYRYYNVHGREVGYPTNQNSPAGQWLRINPQRMPLGQVGFELSKLDGSPVNMNEIKNIFQRLNLWEGVIESRFEINNDTVFVTTVCNPQKDLISVRVRSVLLKKGLIKIAFKFPYAYDPSIKNNPPYIWNKPDAHSTDIIKRAENYAELKRVVDSSSYFVFLNWSAKSNFKKIKKHYFLLTPDKDYDYFEFSFGFSNNKIIKNIPGFKDTYTSSIENWKRFWTEGGAVDFSGSTDPRANELERRIILSQYLTAIQFAGNFPPQESGLTLSSWYGKHNTEMIWWHAAQFALWGRADLLEKNLRWYISDLPYAESTAKEQGFKGARWSKMVSPDGHESPGNNPFIIWNQPHPIYLAELCHRADNNKKTLEKYKQLVFQTAEFMASFAYFDSAKQHYVLGPPVWPAQEIYNPLKVLNPTFELAYWKLGLEVAEKWLQRLGIKSNKKWEDVIKNISPLPVKDSLYVVVESLPDTFTNPESRKDHPSMLMAMGFLPGDMVNKVIMRKTLKNVINNWDWKAKIWGWDYPMIAMTAVRLNEPETAIDILLKDAPHNHYLNNGDCPQTDDLPVYLPANGALLSAVALMVAGSDETGSLKLPGFPKNGKWKIKYENISKLP